MGLKLYEENYIRSIANSIRAKGVSGSWTVSQMPSAIASIPSGSNPSGTYPISSNGTYNISDYASVSVNVAIGYLRFVVDSNGNSLYTGSSDEDCANWISQHGKTVKWATTPVFCVN